MIDLIKRPQIGPARVASWAKRIPVVTSALDVAAVSFQPMMINFLMSSALRMLQVLSSSITASLMSDLFRRSAAKRNAHYVIVRLVFVLSVPLMAARIISILYVVKEVGGDFSARD